MRALALAAAATAALLIPAKPWGLAIPLVAALMLAARAAARSPSAGSGALALLAFALVLQAALLDARWVVTLDLVVAWMTASAAADGRGWAILWAPFRRLNRLPALSPSSSRISPAALRGVAAGTLVVFPFAVLFLTADAAFAALASELPLPAAEALPWRVVAFAVVGLATLGLCLAAREPLRTQTPLPPRRLGLLEWAIPLALLNGLFVAFVLVQLTVLFGGNDRVLRTTGLTYAEYARSGFWQLLAAGAMTLLVLRGAVWLADGERRRDRVILHTLVGGLIALTFVVLVSAVHRLDLYVDAYGLTRLRLAAQAAVLAIGGLLALVVVAGVSARLRRRMDVVAVGLASVGMLLFSFANPDRLVAERNVERWRQTGRIDLGYLGTLSADAAPALLELPPALRGEATSGLRTRLAEDEPWSSANRSRARARELLHP